MTIIDRYLLSQFLKTFLICFVSLTGLYIVFDVFTNLDEFLRCGKATGGVWSLLGSFYVYQAIAFFDRAAGLITLVAAMFTISWMQRHNEMTALQAAGISRIRIVTPLIVAAVAVALLSAVNRELIIPRFREELARTPQDLIGDRAQQLRPRYDSRTDILLGGEATYYSEKQIKNPSFLLLSPELSDYAKKLVAAEASYMSPQDDRPGGYLLKGVTEPKGLAKMPSMTVGDEVIVITSHDADWLKPDECFVKSEVTFDQLTGGRAFKEFSSTFQMIDSLDSFDYAADLRTKIHCRIVKVFLDITLLFLGLPLVVSRENRNVFVAIGMCFGVTTVFFLVEIACQSMGAKSLLDPALAAWVPLIIFAPVAVGLTESMWQ